jgi:hypothetical protein
MAALVISMGVLAYGYGLFSKYDITPAVECV